MTDAIQVVTTTDKQEDAANIASSLVEQRLAACVQVSGPVTSCYWWQGSIERDEEWLCTIKTTAEAYQDVEEAIRQLHSYDEPEIIATPITACSQGYLDWLSEHVAGGKS
ncbi:MAG: divalent-cation tolerance protein CutA [Planctomycetota bacterium]